MSQVKSRQILENELNRYQTQLQKLEEDKSYINYEDARDILRNFYTEKISEYQARIDIKETTDLDVKYEVIYAHRSNDTVSKKSG